MKITNIHIENFRSIVSLDIALDDTTVFIGSNNSGKSAILEGIKIGLSRRWGQKGTGFTENDVHLIRELDDPRKAPPVKIEFEFEETTPGIWPQDMIDSLEEIIMVSPNGNNKVSFSVTYTWDTTKETFEPAWEFLNSSGQPLPSRKRGVNLLSNFYDYILFLWLGALRDPDEEFNSRSRNWGTLLRGIKVPEALEKTIKDTLDKLDADLLAADPRLGEIAQTIGKATEIAITENPGTAKLRMLPLNVWDMLSRAGIVLQNQNLRPWLPLDHHGQGLQSLSIIFLFQAVAKQQLSESTNEGLEPIFAIEEPEAHLHPQAARTLWKKISELPGQKIVTTHSPYFVQNVPLHNLRLVKFHEGETKVSFLPREIKSDIPWTSNVEKMVAGKGITYLTKDIVTSTIISTKHFESSIEDDLIKCWKGDPKELNYKKQVEELRNACRVLISPEEEIELSFLGRRIRGEIFFANKWVLVEGVCEYLLLNALGEIYDFNFDQHGVSIIDFQNNGNASIYPAIADAFNIPWLMITDGDSENERFKKSLLKRGFTITDVASKFSTLTLPNSIEDQLLTDGNEALLRNILDALGCKDALTCTLTELKTLLKKRKTEYIASLCKKIIDDHSLAAKMPKAFIDLILKLKKK